MSLLIRVFTWHCWFMYSYVWCIMCLYVWCRIDSYVWQKFIKHSSVVYIVFICHCWFMFSYVWCIMCLYVWQELACVHMWCIVFIYVYTQTQICVCVYVCTQMYIQNKFSFHAFICVVSCVHMCDLNMCSCMWPVSISAGPLWSETPAHWQIYRALLRIYRSLCRHSYMVHYIYMYSHL